MYAPALSGAHAREEEVRAALLDAYQAVSVLLSAQGVRAGKVAVVGRGEAAGLALALAALRPEEVAQWCWWNRRRRAGDRALGSGRLGAAGAVPNAAGGGAYEPQRGAAGQPGGVAGRAARDPRGARRDPVLAVGRGGFCERDEPAPAPSEAPVAEEGGMPVDLSQE